MTVPTDEAVTREAIEGLYRAFEQKSVPLLRKVVTPDWEYVPEPVACRQDPTRWFPYSRPLPQRCRI